MSDGTIRSDEYKMVMEKKGFEVRFPKPNEIQLDFDSFVDYTRSMRTLDALNRRIKCTATINPSKSGLPKRHVSVFLDRNLSNVERIALQAILGSDPLRELLGMFQHWDGDPVPTLLVERQGVKPKELVLEGCWTDQPKLKEVF